MIAWEQFQGLLDVYASVEIYVSKCASYTLSICKQGTFPLAMLQIL